MAKGIYCLKIFLSRREFKLTKKEERALVRICAFIVSIYVRPWSTATNVSEAPLNDIDLLRTLNSYKDYDKKMADVCIDKFSNHLWYLNEDIIAFSFFDQRISIESKEKIVEKFLKFRSELREPAESDDNDDEDTKMMPTPNKLILLPDDLDQFLQKDFPASLLTKKSFDLFERFNISITFLEEPPNTVGKKKIDALKIVNDTAERGVKLMEEFGTKFTKNETQKQFLLQVCTLTKFTS